MCIRDRSSTLEELAQGAADHWFDIGSPALIMIGEALQEESHAARKEGLQSPSTEVDNSLQNSLILANSKRRA